MTLQKPAGTDKSVADHQRRDAADQLYSGEKQSKSCWFNTETILCFHCNFSSQFHSVPLLVHSQCVIMKRPMRTAEWQWPSYRTFWNAPAITLNSFNGSFSSELEQMLNTRNEDRRDSEGAQTWTILKYFVRSVSKFFLWTWCQAALHDPSWRRY